MKLNKGLLLSLIVPMLLSIAWSASATGNLKVTLTQPADKAEAEAGIITVTFENTGDTPVSIFKWKSPFAINDDRLANPQFSVRNILGQEMSYVGRNVKFGGISPTNFIVLEPNHTISKNVDVGSDYGLTEGSYTVTFSIDLTTRPEFEGKDGEKLDTIPLNSQISATSNALTIWITPSFVDAKKLKSFSLNTLDTNQYVCKAEQLSELSTIMSTAASQASSALNYFASSYQWTFDSQGVPVSVNNTDSRYTHWFGTFDSNSPPTDLNSVNSQVDQTMSATYYRIDLAPESRTLS